MDHDGVGECLWGKLLKEGARLESLKMPCEITEGVTKLDQARVEANRTKNNSQQLSLMPSAIMAKYKIAVDNCHHHLSL